MRKSNQSAKEQTVQATLSQLEHVAVEQNEHDHLIAHLVEQDEDEKFNFEWTRVFSRADINSQRAAIFPMGPDLHFDKSMRDILT